MPDLSTHHSNSPLTAAGQTPPGFTVNPETGEILSSPPPSPRSQSARRFDAYLADGESRLLHYVENFGELQAAAAVGEIPAPEGGWKAAWRAAGAAAAASYLEQKAKTHQIQFEPGFQTRSDFTCDGAAKWVMHGVCRDASGEVVDDVAQELVCGREWCGRCSINADPNTEGSKAHRRRIARWLPRAMQLEHIGYFVFTYPRQVRPRLRDVRELAEDGKSLKRMLQHRGYGRGMRRLHWFGEPENGRNGVPELAPHHNVLVDTGFLSSDEIEAIKRRWAELLKRRYGYSGPAVVHYSFASTPGQKYHRVRYVTRATFLNRDWDQQMAEEIIGFRNASTWGKWEGPALWEPELADAPPSAEAQLVAAGSCPGGHPVPVLIEWLGVTEAMRLDLDGWQHVGEGYFYRHRRHRGGAP